MAKKEKEPYRIALGNICAAIWSNENGKGGVWYNVTITRSYREGEVWKDAKGFSRDDLPVVREALARAYSWIWDRTIEAQQERAVEE